MATATMLQTGTGDDPGDQPQSPAAPTRREVEAEADEHMERMESLEKNDDPLTDPERIVDMILTIASGHDRVLQYLEERMFRHLSALTGTRTKFSGDDVVNEYRYALIEFCARFAPVAARQVPAAAVIARAVAHHDTLYDLRDEELTAFMGPLFEEAGVGDRFEVRQGFEVYGLE